VGLSVAVLSNRIITDPFSGPGGVVGPLCVRTFVCSYDDCRTKWPLTCIFDLWWFILTQSMSVRGLRSYVKVHGYELGLGRTQG